MADTNETGNGKGVKGHAERRAGRNDSSNGRVRTHPRENEVTAHQSGNVIVRVYANRRWDGGVVFKTELVRAYSTPTGEGESFTFEVRDLYDAVRCLKWAQTWLWRAERQAKREAKQQYRSWW